MGCLAPVPLSIFRSNSKFDENSAALGPCPSFTARWQRSTSWQSWTGRDSSPFTKSRHSLKLLLPIPLGANINVTVRFKILGWRWRITVAITKSGCWCCGRDVGSVCKCGEVAILSSEALFLAITVLSVYVQVVFILGMWCNPSESLPYLQRRCHLITWWADIF